MVYRVERVPVESADTESRDLAEIRALLTDRYIDHRIRVLDDARDFRFRSHAAYAGGLTVDNITYWAALEVSTDPPVQVTVLTLLEGDYIAGSGRGEQRVGVGGAVLFVPGAAATMRFDRIRYNLIQFPADALTRALTRIGVDAGDFRFDASVPVSDTMNRHWRTTAAYLSKSFAGPDPAAAHPLILANALEAAAAAVVTVFPNSAMTVPYTPGPGRIEPAAVRRAVSFIDANADRPITVDDIAVEAGLSVRGLQAGFARHRGTTPMAYLRRVRMEHVHRELQAGDRARGDTVAGTAQRWGFANLGRFAVEYRKTYGQSPSHTLRV